MLVLSRKLGDKVVIGDSIVVTVIKIDRNQIRLGIEAPHDMPVYREEISPSRVLNERPRNKFTEWSIRYHAADPTGEHVRLGVAALHTAFPGSTISIEPAEPDGDTLNMTPPPGTSAEDVNRIAKQARTALKRIFQRYLPYHGWTIRYQTGQPQSSAVQRRLYALKRQFPGADVGVEHSDSSRDRLAIKHTGWANSDAKLSAFQAANVAMKEATSARIDELRHTDKALLSLLFQEALTPPAGNRHREPAGEGPEPDDYVRCDQYVLKF
jgi:carbon storage regulator